MLKRPKLLMLVMAAAMAGCQMPVPQSQGAAPGPAQPAAAVSKAGLPSGTIVAYYGTDVPAGWVLCDGRTLPNGRRTPDLRNRFIMGMDPAAGTPLGASGGSTGHRHDAVSGRPRGKQEEVDSGDEHAANDDHTHEVTVQPSNHLPPYVQLFFIMKE